MTISDIFDRYLGQPKPLKRLRVATHTPLERLPMVAICISRYSALRKLRR